MSVPGILFKRNVMKIQKVDLTNMIHGNDKSIGIEVEGVLVQNFEKIIEMFGEQHLYDHKYQLFFIRNEMVYCCEFSAAQVEQNALIDFWFDSEQPDGILVTKATYEQLTRLLLKTFH